MTDSIGKLVIFLSFARSVLLMVATASVFIWFCWLIFVMVASPGASGHGNFIGKEPLIVLVVFLMLLVTSVTAPYSAFHLWLTVALRRGKFSPLQRALLVVDTVILVVVGLYLLHDMHILLRTHAYGDLTALVTLALGMLNGLMLWSGRNRSPESA